MIILLALHAFSLVPSSSLHAQDTTEVAFLKSLFFANVDAGYAYRMNANGGSRNDENISYTSEDIQGIEFQGKRRVPRPVLVYL